MKLVLATSNRGKVKEIERFLKEFKIVPYSDLIDHFEIEEYGSTFQENAIIKAKAVFNALKHQGKSEIVLADDSGISVQALNWQPNILSARYAGANATSEENLDKMIQELNQLKISSSPAFYTASIAIINRNEEVWTTHGWMHGKVITQKIGNGGFGYDPIFIPQGETETLGVLHSSVKEKHSHRIKALKLAKIILSKLITKR